MIVTRNDVILEIFMLVLFPYITGIDNIRVLMSRNP